MRIGWLAAALLVFTACGGDDEEPAAAAKDAAQRIEDGVSSVTKTVEITEDNDPNNDIGRPGSYQKATVFYDSRTECDDAATVDVSCGAKIEVFENERAADNRQEYLEALVGSASGLITEYDYRDGNVLLRVSGNLKPSEAEEYEAAFAD